MRFDELPGWLQGAIALIGFPSSFIFMILAWAAPVVSIIWLLFLGQWPLLLFGLILGFVAPGLISAVIAALTIVAMKMQGGARRIGEAVIFLVSFALLCLYCIWIFAVGVQHSTGHMILPFVLWSYATAITPWQVIASKTRRDSASAIFWNSAAQFGGLFIGVGILCGLHFGVGWLFIAGALLGSLIGWAMGAVG